MASKIIGILILSLPLIVFGHPDANPDIRNAKFSKILAGTFKMGSPITERARRTFAGRDRLIDQEAQHVVILTKDYEIQTTEVTQAQWFHVMGYNFSEYNYKEACPGEHEIVEGVKLCTNNPVERVSWNEIQEFIRKLNQLDDKYSYRLPTEAEWEFAVRAGTHSAYFFGEYTAEGLHTYAWWAPAMVPRFTSMPVGLKKPNQNGLYDVYGNVAEYTSDWYEPFLWEQDWQKPITWTVVDPKGPAKGSGHVVKGGDWKITAGLGECRSAARTRSSSENDARIGNFGIRLVRVQK